MYTLDEFMTAVDQSDGIVCYGIGKRFHMFLREFQETPIIEKLRFCIDAYADNQHIKTENRLLEVQGLSSLQTISSDKVISKTYCSEYEKIICITSRWQSKINEEFMFDGLNVKIENGILVGLKTQNGKLKAAISERGAKILVNGMPVEYGVIE